jgi:hypothetical protein
MMWMEIKCLQDPGGIFKEYTWMLLIGDEQLGFLARKCVGRFSKERKETFRIMLGGCRGVHYVDNIIVEARRNPGILCLPTSKTHPFIDFVYCERTANETCFFAFKSTVSATRSSMPKEIAQFEANIRASERVNVFSLIPPTQSDKFATNSGCPKTKSRAIHFFRAMIPEPTWYSHGEKMQGT